jgi:hypothetical protein
MAQGVSKRAIAVTANGLDESGVFKPALISAAEKREKHAANTRNAVTRVRLRVRPFMRTSDPWVLPVASIPLSSGRG